MGTGLPDFSGLPGTWQVIAYGVFAMAVFALILAGRFGIRLRGIIANAPEKQAEVAAVVVNPVALQQATAAVEALNVSAVHLNSLLKAKVRSELANAREMKRLADCVEKAVDLFGQFVADQHAEREEEEYDREVERRIKERDAAEAAAKARPPPRRRAVKKKPSP